MTWKQALALSTVVSLVLALGACGAATGGGGAPPPGGDGGGGGAGVASYFLPYVVNGTGTDMTDPVAAVDGAGGVHVAYRPAAGDATEPAYYGECAAGCGDVANLAVTAVGGADSVIGDLNLQLDPQGRPRLLWSVFHGFRYAACDAACTTSAAWTVSDPIPGLVDLTDDSNRMFALDPQGRPRFLYTDDNSGHFGLFFDWCDSGCTAAANWHEQLLSNQRYTRPSLAIGSDGIPRFAFLGDYGGRTLFSYGACVDATCSDWSGALFFDVDTVYADVALQLDGADRPRAALYTGPSPGAGGLAADATYSLWCDSACTDPNAGTWGGQNVGPGADDTVYNPLDLALDGAGLPYLAIGTEGGMSLLWCAAGCETGGAQWQGAVLDDPAQLDQSDPVPPPAGCSGGFWSFGGSDFGYGVMLALGPEGFPHLVYDADHLTMCSGHVETNVAEARYSQVAAQ